MRSFTDEEYELMIYELTEKEPASFDMLCAIAYKSLHNVVIRWCSEDPALCGRQLDGDIMQEIAIRLIKTCVTGFLKRDDRDGVINRDPVQFNAWMFKVAVNIKRDTANAQRAMDIRTKQIDERHGVVSLYDDLDEDRKEKISTAFQIAAGANKKVHILLTWLLQSLLILEYDLKKKEATHFMVDSFGNKTLFELWKLIQAYLSDLPWIELSRERRDCLIKKLEKPQTSGIQTGKILYKDFFMKKGGTAAISDWVNRVNSFINSRVKYEPFN